MQPSPQQDVEPSRSSQAEAASRSVCITHVTNSLQGEREDSLSVEEPLEIILEYGSREERRTRSISVTMRTPGHDAELVAGFMLTEGILSDSGDIEYIGPPPRLGQSEQHRHAACNRVTVALAPSVRLNLASLERNFYTTSSCGICGKASLLALRSVCPPRSVNRLHVSADLLYDLPRQLRASQQAFAKTGGLHACGLFDREGKLLSVREDVGRHNACDKLLGHEFLADRTPLRNCILLLSGRASFELLQKGAMAGVPLIASLGAPSSLAVEVARDFDVTLVGFLRESSFNIYHGAERIILNQGRSTV